MNASKKNLQLRISYNTPLWSANKLHCFLKKEKIRRHSQQNTHTHNIFFFIPLLDAISSKKKIIALNFISKTHDSEQLITKNPQRKKKKKEVQTHVWSTKTYKLQLVHNYSQWWRVCFMEIMAALVVSCIALHCIVFLLPLLALLVPPKTRSTGNLASEYSKYSC